MAERARREGLLALEEEAQTVDDPFIEKGVRLVVDGTDPELVKDILDLEVESMAGRHHHTANAFQQAGGFAPTVGIIGTVLSLVHVLGHLDNPATIGPAIASAFVATLFGVASANIFYLPVAQKLKSLSTDECEAQDDDHRGHPLDPGGRQPAHRRGEAEDVPRRRPSASSRPRRRRRGRRKPRRSRRRSMARKKREHEHPDERWLVSYADMITVLMALFIVLFSISVVNKGKFEELAKSLKESFNGAIDGRRHSVLNFGTLERHGAGEQEHRQRSRPARARRPADAEVEAERLERSAETAQAHERRARPWRRSRTRACTRPRTRSTPRCSSSASRTRSRPRSTSAAS